MISAGSSLVELQTLAGYRKCFTSKTLWNTHIRTIFDHQGWKCNKILAGKPGTFPVFLVDGKRVIKFFGPLFSGEACWQVEQEAAGLMAALPCISVPSLLSYGEVPGETGWHYLVFEILEGISIGDVYSDISHDEKLRLACWLGSWLPEMHRLAMPVDSRLPILTAEIMREWFESRWEVDRQRWPAHLATQVEGYIKRKGHHLELESKIFIHADLTQDHLLGRLENGGWTTTGVIDFGDAMQGSFFYELVALHLDLFNCDKSLLRAFLREYGFTPAGDFSRTVMVTSLMHQFDVIGYLLTWKQELRNVGSLEELEARLWDVGA